MIKQICARTLSLMTVFLLLNNLAYSLNYHSDYHKNTGQKKESSISHKTDESSILIIENEEVETRIDDNYDDLVDNKLFELYHSFTFVTKEIHQKKSFIILKQNDTVLKSEKWMVNIQILI